MSGARKAGVGLLILALSTSAALAVCCLAVGGGTSGWARATAPGFDFRAGWLGWSVGNGAPQSLRSLSFGTSVSAIVAAAVAMGAVALSAVYVGIAACGGAGGHVAAVAAPVSIVLAAALAVAYALLAAFGARQAQRATGRTVVPYPDAGLCLGLGAALLWAVAACFACGLPSRPRARKAAAAAAPPPPPPPGPLATAAAARVESDGPSTAAPFNAAGGYDPEALGAAANSEADRTAAKFAGSGGKRAPSKKKGAAAADGGGPAAPASAFGAPPLADDADVAPPAVFAPEPPPPEALPPPKAGFFEGLKRAVSGKE